MKHLICNNMRLVTTAGEEPLDHTRPHACCLTSHAAWIVD
jgi:hypothetical protein